MEVPFGLDAWLFWSLLGIALFILELMTPGFVLACFGVGALAAVLPALVDLGMPWQLAVFSLGSLLTFIFIRPIINRKPLIESYPIGLAALKGRKIRLSEDIPADGYIEVPIDGDVWRLRMNDRSLATKGSLVVILGISGTMLVASPAPEDYD